MGAQKRIESEPTLNPLMTEIEFVESNGVPKSKEEWHMLDAKWMRDWARYVRNAGPHPGAITNSNLLDPNLNFSRVRGLLDARSDYVPTSPAVWRFLQERYGGGPRLHAHSANIYTAKIDFAGQAQPPQHHKVAERPRPESLVTVSDGIDEFMKNKGLKDATKDLSSYEIKRTHKENKDDMLMAKRTSSRSRKGSKTPSAGKSPSNSVTSSWLWPLRALLPSGGSNSPKSVEGGSDSSPMTAMMSRTSSTSQGVSEQERDKRYQEFSSMRGHQLRPGLAIRNAGKSKHRDVALGSL